MYEITCSALVAQVGNSFDADKNQTLLEFRPIPETKRLLLLSYTAFYCQAMPSFQMVMDIWSLGNIWYRSLLHVIGMRSVAWVSQSPQCRGLGIVGLPNSDFMSLPFQTRSSDPESRSSINTPLTTRIEVLHDLTVKTVKSVSEPIDPSVLRIQ
ncbi:unnamed protein product [Protopolystoma xenopodis]|uniref:Uncharacterized protein n=1 Tax=Protopolystoma xenopodis TaxID=117903 RepID=A0A448X3W7_9PLAT|nr:unnamed protein product [Protopolystoma xenopodis]